MAKFLKINNNYLNVDMIISMGYSKENDTTTIITPFHTVISEDGDITNAIIKVNNELTTRDKLFIKDIVYSIKALINTITRLLQKRG